MTSEPLFAEPRREGAGGSTTTVDEGDLESVAEVAALLHRTGSSPAIESHRDATHESPKWTASMGDERVRGGDARSSLRAFLAVDLTDAVKESVAAEISRLRPLLPRAVRWTRAENLHITLRFLGEISSDIVPKLVEALRVRVGAFPAFEAHLTEVTLFPSVRRPRVIAARVEPEQEFSDLAAAVDSVVAVLGFPRESRPFHPHVTVGRWRGRAPSAWESSSFPPATVSVEAVTLFRSDLRPSGPIYSRLGTCPLG